MNFHQATHTLFGPRFHTRAGAPRQRATPARTFITGIILLALLPAAFGARASGQGTAGRSTKPLSAGETAEGRLANGVPDYYKLDLGRDEFFQVRVEQKGLDVELRLYDADDKEVAHMDSPNGLNGPETLSFVANAPGSFTLEVSKNPDQRNGNGSYTIRRAEPRSPTTEDLKRVATERLFFKGMSGLADKAPSKKVMSDLTDALQGWHELKDDYMITMTGMALAGALLNEAKELEDSGKDMGPQRLPQEAIDKALAAVKICQDIKESQCESVGLFLLGNIYSDTENPEDAQQALKVYQQALDVIASSGNTSAEAREGKILTLSNMGLVLFTQQKYEGALQQYQQALSLYGSGEENEHKASLLLRIGNANTRLRRFALGESAYTDSMKIYERLKLPCDEAIVRNKLGEMYKSQDAELLDAKALVRALGTFLDAEKNFKTCAETGGAFEDRRVLNLSSISEIYKKLNDSEKQAEYERRANEISNSLVQPRVQVLSYFERGLEASVAGQPTEALQMYQKALDILPKTNSPSWMKAEILKKMAFAHIALSRSYRLKGMGKQQQEEMSQAAATFAEAYHLIEELDDKVPMARFLFDFGKALLRGGAYEKAINAHISAVRLLMSKENKSKDPETELIADITQSLSTSYAVTNKMPEALHYLRIALWLRTTFNDKDGIAETLHASMSIFARLGKRRLAIFYGKQAVMLNLTLRHSIKTLDIETQQEFLRGNREIYEELTNLLIQEGRLEEAQQVINIYRDQEFFDFASNEANLRGLQLTSREEEARTRFEQISTKLRPIAQLLKDIAPLDPTGTLAEQKKAEAEKSRDLFMEATHEMEAMLKQMESDFDAPASEKDSVTGTPVAEDEECWRARQRPGNGVRDTAEMQSALCRLGKRTEEKYAVIYTFTTEDKLYVLLVTPDGVKAFSNPTKADSLNEKVEGFLHLLRVRTTPSQMVQQAGADFYDIIFGAKSSGPVGLTLGAELEKYKPGVLLWSLDGKLRYIPTAALYDSKKGQYLIEKYQTAVFTRAEKERFMHETKPWDYGLGLGAAKPSKLTCGDGSLGELPGVIQELPEIFDGEPPRNRGIFKGPYLLNGDFTRRVMVDRLKAQHPSFVHISSHFCFQPGDARKSFLLLGDGEPFSLYQMQDYPDLFEGVELLVLSACKTAATEPNNATGKEIDSFAELAQRLRATSVLATLWDVGDDGSPKLMLQFYRLHKAHPDWPKAELLRQAQMSLLKTERPYYWAPFVLYGGFR